MAQHRYSSNAYRQAKRPGPSSGKATNSKRPPANKVRAKKKSSNLIPFPKIKQGNLDSGLLLTVVVLVIFGLIMVYSASAPAASAYQDSPYYFIVRQAAFAPVGIVLMLTLSKIDYHLYTKFMTAIFFGNFLVLFTVYIPGLGVVVNQARRWINIGISTLQPSELVKVGVIMYFSYSLSLIKPDEFSNPWKGFFRYMAVLGVLAVILLKEPHLSATLVICAVGCIIMLVAGVKMRYFMICGAVVPFALVYIIMKNPYQLERITTFLDPFADKSDAGFQVVNSLYAIGSGGIFGLGLGMSRQKFLYLPEPHNDFIFAIVCEELGLLGAALVLALFGILIWKGFRIAQKAPDMFGTLLATGITSLVAIQTIINVGVVTSSLPATGVALPFFSYGGTSLVILLCCMGVLLNISRQSEGVVKPKVDSKKIK